MSQLDIRRRFGIRLDGVPWSAVSAAGLTGVLATRLWLAAGSSEWGAALAMLDRSLALGILLLALACAFAPLRVWMVPACLLVGSLVAPSGFVTGAAALEPLHLVAAGIAACLPLGVLGLRLARRGTRTIERAVVLAAASAVVATTLLFQICASWEKRQHGEVSALRLSVVASLPRDRMLDVCEAARLACLEAGLPSGIPGLDDVAGEALSVDGVRSGYSSDEGLAYAMAGRADGTAVVVVDERSSRAWGERADFRYGVAALAAHSSWLALALAVPAFHRRRRRARSPAACA